MEIVIADPEAVQIHVETAEVMIDINQESVLSYMSNMLDARKNASESRARPCTIFKVPDDVKEVDPGAYEPRTVSIGPFNRGNPKLLPMEGIEWQFLLDLINRNPSNSLARYIDAVSNPSFIQEIAKCYSVQVIGADGGNEFVQTMVLDGCFIVEFLIKSILGISMGELVERNRNHLSVESDLLLIENQIPFRVLDLLFNLTSSPVLHDRFESITFSKLAMAYLSRNLGSRTLAIPKVIHHLLHLRYICYLQPPIRASQSWSVTRVIGGIKQAIWKPLFWGLSLFCCWRTAPYEASWPLIGSATELCKAGISFVPKIRSGSILDVTFRASDGVIEIPLLSVQSTTLFELRNMLVWEQDMPSLAKRFTPYAFFMENLVNTPDDVAILVNSGVLINHLHSNEEVARFFVSLSDGTALSYQEHYMMELFDDVKKYCNEGRHRLRASLMQTYFSNPWSAISLFAAILLLLLTILQAFFATVAYVHPPKP